MKLTPIIVLCLLALVLAPPPATATKTPGTDYAGPDRHCDMSWSRANDISEHLNLLSVRYYLASLEVTKDPDHFIQVRRQVSRAVRQLVERFGAECIAGLDAKKMLTNPAAISLY